MSEFFNPSMQDLRNDLYMRSFIVVGKYLMIPHSTFWLINGRRDLSCVFILKKIYLISTSSYLSLVPPDNANFITIKSLANNILIFLTIAFVMKVIENKVFLVYKMIHCLQNTRTEIEGSILNVI